MCSSQFGEFTQAYSLPAENSRSGMDEEQPPRYVVKDDREGGFLKVHGFRTWRPEVRFIMWREAIQKINTGSSCVCVILEL